MMLRLILVGTLSVCWQSPSRAQESYSPEVSRTYPDRVYWGDTHLHTALSGDAMAGGTRLGPDEAYRFARGEEVTSNTGLPAKLRRPLDFIVVADHANNIGAAYSRHFYLEDPAFRETEIGRSWQRALADLEQRDDIDQQALESGSLLPTHRPWQISVRDEAFRRSVWHQITGSADRYNEAGVFTAFIGYEWTPLGDADHRIMIFRDDAATANRVLPFSSFDSRREEELWAYLAKYEAETKGSILAIPHNGNLTSGNMFRLEDSYGQPLTAAYSRLRSRWEPLLEATQIKGDSETHPYLSPTDEFADYETWNGWGGTRGNRPGADGVRPPARANEKIQYEYARSALKLGLAEQAEKGANPFKYGMIGSSDAHTSLAAVDEDNFFGKVTAGEPSARRLSNRTPTTNWEMAASGYAAVWATENTREALFDAMRRREAYATTGPRMTVRLFGGWDFVSADADRRDPASVGYEKGVPMGGDLAQAPRGKSPSFLIRAVKDPDGANLDRVQVIKGWRSSGGELHEKVYSVALSDGRVVARDGKVEPVGNTVDVAEATYLNSIGDPELAVVWRDPEFKPEEHAFYYLRVLEIPTPRWTAYDAKFYGVTDVPDGIPMITQERAYSSPIWYTPRLQK